MNNSDFFQNMSMDSNVTGNNNFINQDMDVDVNMNMNSFPSQVSGCPQTEGVRERIINRTFVHEVPQPCFFMADKNREV